MTCHHDNDAASLNENSNAASFRLTLSSASTSSDSSPLHPMLLLPLPYHHQPPPHSSPLGGHVANNNNYDGIDAQVSAAAAAFSVPLVGTLAGSRSSGESHSKRTSDQVEGGGGGGDVDNEDSTTTDGSTTTSASTASATTTTTRGPPQTVIIPPPAAPYAQLCYNRAEDRLVTLIVGKTTFHRSSNIYLPLDDTDEEQELHHHNNHRTCPHYKCYYVPLKEEEEEEHNSARDKNNLHLPVVVSTADRDQDAHSLHSNSSGFSTSYSVTTRENSSCSSSSCGSSESTVRRMCDNTIMNLAPQEIVWMDESWIRSGGTYSSDDHLALLHDLASRSTSSDEYDLETISGSGSCGKKLLRSVALCKVKIKANSSKPIIRASSSSLYSKSPSRLVSGKLYDYSVLN